MGLIMYNAIVITGDEQIERECRSILSLIDDIDVIFFASAKELEQNGYHFNLLLVIITELNVNVLQKLNYYKKSTPDLSIVLYNHSLSLSSFNGIGDDTDIKLIVGENRKEILADLVESVKKNYWRIIPLEQFGIEYKTLSPRIKEALRFIEHADINECNIAGIAAHLKISPGYFSQEFKRETGQSFRKFMQKVINYYEDIIFTKVNIPAKNISRLLGYSELSSFSRSFKKRKGISPAKYRKMINA